MSTPRPTDNLGLALINGVAADNLTDATADAAEALLDSLTEASDVLEAIPLFGTAIKLFRAGIGIHDRLFLQKLSKFLLQLQAVPLQDRQAFVVKLNQDPKFKKRVGENLVLLIDRLDDMGKAVLLGKLFQAHMSGRTDYALFRRFSGILDRAYLPDLVRLKQFGQDTPGDDEVVALETLGLAYQSVFDGGNAAGVSVSRYRVSELGQKLAALLFG